MRARALEPGPEKPHQSGAEAVAGHVLLFLAPFAVLLFPVALLLFPFALAAAMLLVAALVGPVVALHRGQVAPRGFLWTLAAGVAAAAWLRFGPSYSTYDKDLSDIATRSLLTIAGAPVLGWVVFRSKREAGEVSRALAPRLISGACLMALLAAWVAAMTFAADRIGSPVYSGRRFVEWTRDAESPDPAVRARAVAPLTAALNSFCFSVAMDAAGALGGMGTEARGAVPDLRRLLAGGGRHLGARDYTRLSAALALSAIPPEGLEALAQALRSGATAEAREALYGIEIRFRSQAVPGAGPEAAVLAPPLAALLKDQHPSTRERAAHILGALGPFAVAALPDLLQALDDPEVSVRLPAALAVIAVAPERAGETLQVLADSVTAHPNPYDQRRAIAALEAMGAAAEAARGQLRNALRDPEAEVRVAAARLLWKLGEPLDRLLPVLTDVLRKKGWYREREAAAGALGDMGPAAAEAVPALREALQDVSEQVRQAAARALESIGGSP